ncbi:Bug family tripartite tricarboxylate transporter substrate binding protein [Alkalilacustris brevis]|uniref:Bug family tripartite tricarboxylate transporter substrate binding protein n=1 Tax=Alkalilacustris brevis TaxID=2026338 RepID=UPI000E0DC927|nr:tripartite tricarboxylate transporter substrate binding protein [Alkalilacustris brevis]
MKNTTALAAILLTATTGVALAEWPERPVTVVVSQGAGASPDIMARLVADQLTEAYGSPFIVDNRPGGANVVGSLSVANADPDGYTIFFATSAALVTNPYLMANLPYDPLTDFDPAVLVAMSNIMVTANPDSGIETIEDLLEAERANPGSISLGVDSPRNLSGIIARSINHVGEVDLTLVSYNSIPQMVQDTVSGEIPVSIQSASVATPFIAEGSLHPVAVASAQRTKAHPDVPTIAETLPGIDLTGWFMFVAPAGTDPEILASLNATVNEILAKPEVEELASSLGYELVGDLDVAGSLGHLEAQFENWATITSNLGIQPE